MSRLEDEEKLLRKLINQHTTEGSAARVALSDQLAMLMSAYQAARLAAARTPTIAGIDEALQIVADHADGERLLERAYRADPARTSIELNYLGADRIRGALAVSEALRF